MRHLWFVVVTLVACQVKETESTVQQPIEASDILDDLGCSITCPYVTAVADYEDTPSVEILNNLDLTSYLRSPARPGNDDAACAGVLPLDVVAGLTPAAACRDAKNSPPTGPRVMISKIYKGSLAFPGSMDNQGGTPIYAVQGQRVLEVVHNIAATAQSVIDMSSLTHYTGYYKDALARGIARNVYRMRTGGSCAAGLSVTPGLIVRMSFPDWGGLTASVFPFASTLKDFTATLKTDINNFYNLLLAERCAAEGVAVPGNAPKATDAITFVGLNVNWTNGWNHSKIITNGYESMIGGQNLWSDDYIAHAGDSSMPVEDVNFHIRNQGGGLLGDNASAALMSTIDSFWRTYEGEDQGPAPPWQFTTPYPWADTPGPGCDAPDPCEVTTGQYNNLSSAFDWGWETETFMRRRDQLQFHYTWIVRSYGSAADPTFILTTLGVALLTPTSIITLLTAGFSIVMQAIDVFTNSDIAGGDRVNALLYDRAGDGEPIYVVQQDFWLNNLLAMPPIATDQGTTRPTMALIRRVARLGMKAIDGVNVGPSGPIRIIKSSSGMVPNGGDKYTMMTATQVDAAILSRAFGMYQGMGGTAGEAAFAAGVHAAGFEVRRFRYSANVGDFGLQAMDGTWTPPPMLPVGGRIHAKIVATPSWVVVGSDNHYDTGNAEAEIVSRDPRFINPLHAWLDRAWASSNPDLTGPEDGDGGGNGGGGGDGGGGDGGGGGGGGGDDDGGGGGGDHGGSGCAAGHDTGVVWALGFAVLVLRRRRH